MKTENAPTSPLDFDSSAWLSPKLEVRGRSSGDRGLFAIEPILKGEVLTVMGGAILTGAELKQLPLVWRGKTIQIEEDLFQVSIRVDEPADFMNHSCDPNAGIRGQVTTVAMRDIAADEEVSFDYAMTDASDFDTFECQCGAPECRGRVTGADWRRPELWRRYEGYLSTYIEAKIQNLCAEPSLDAQDITFGEDSYLYLHPALIVKHTGDLRGRGLFATRKIAAGEVLWHDTSVEDRSIRIDELSKLPEDQRKILLQYCWQLDDERIEGPLTTEELAQDASNIWNHSCDPNSWLVSDDKIVARYDISEGDEITCDYATWWSDQRIFDIQMAGDCLCKSENCRGKLSSDDWKRRDLQDNLGTHFLEFIQEKIRDHTA